MNNVHVHVHVNVLSFRHSPPLSCPSLSLSLVPQSLSLTDSICTSADIAAPCDNDKYCWALPSKINTIYQHIHVHVQLDRHIHKLLNHIN